MTDINAAISSIQTALGLFASCIKSGESWSPTCEHMLLEAHAAMLEIIAALEEKQTKTRDK